MAGLTQAGREVAEGQAVGRRPELSNPRWVRSWVRAGRTGEKEEP